MKDLLLLLSRFPFEENNRELLSELIAGIPDWNLFVRLINSHGIIALSVYNIKAAGLDKKIPEGPMSFLENGYRQSIVRNTWLTESWKEVNEILNSANIKHILLKGMALEHSLYGSRGLRQMNDNDIYIKPEDSIKTWDILQKNGFAPEPFKSPLFKKFIFNIGRHLPALYKNGYTLEIHSSIFENQIDTNMESDDPFFEAKEISIGDSLALILSRELQLKHLINHFEHHKTGGECQIRLYTDIVLIDNESKIQIPDQFLADPIQSNKNKFRKAAYKRTVLSVPIRYRLRFIIGDTFPSIKWMKKRYKCNGFKALFFYPLRTAKLRWLI